MENCINKIYEARNDYLNHMNRCKRLPEENARWIIGYEVFCNLLNDPTLTTMYLEPRTQTFFGKPYREVGYIKPDEIFYLNDEDIVIFKIDFSGR